MSEPTSVSALPLGQPATITAICADDQDLVDQLTDHGFRPGEEVEVTHRGLFGGTPLAVRLGHAVVALRKHEAAAIWVEHS